MINTKKRTFFRERTLNCQICIPQCLLTHSFPMHPFSTPWNIRKPQCTFPTPWKYQKPYRFVEKGCIGKKWVNLNRFSFRHHPPGLYLDPSAYQFLKLGQFSLLAKVLLTQNSKAARANHCVLLYSSQFPIGWKIFDETLHVTTKFIVGIFNVGFFLRRRSTRQ